MVEVPDLGVVLRTMLLDAVAAQSTGLLAEHGIPAILMKGRVTASWLYADGERSYGDVDLLVDPAQRTRAMEVLGTLGYKHWLHGAAEVEYGPAAVELIGPNGINIDLHHTLLGIRASTARSWEVLSTGAEEMSVGGRTVRVLAPVIRTLHLALHVAIKGPADTKAVADLERGLAQLPVELWRGAERAARAVDAIEAFSAGLRVVDAGRLLAGDLGLAPPRDIGLVLRSWSVPREALLIQKFVEASSTRSRLSLAARKLWPTAAAMRARFPAARAGAGALLVERLRRIAGLPGTFLVALRHWSRARRTVHQQDYENTGSNAEGQSA